MSKDQRVYLAHILERMIRVGEIAGRGKAAFLADRTAQDAALFNLIVMGEAAKRLDEAYRAAHPQIPWRGFAGLRDVLIHRYESIDLERVWVVLSEDLPELRRSIEAFLPPLDQLERELAGEE